jgi:uncharacterized delta-60 repeat protein
MKPSYPSRQAPFQGWVLLVVALAGNLNLTRAQTLDSFNVPYGTTYGADSMVVQVDGRILTTGQALGYMHRLNADGSVDSTFTTLANGRTYSLAIQMSGQVLAGGDFGYLGGWGFGHLGRLNADGTPDTNFNVNADSSVRCVVEQPDRSILVGGQFAELGQVARTNIGLVEPDTYLDPGFNPGAIGTVYCLAPQPDGKILVAGSLVYLAGVKRAVMGRLNPDGTLDAAFQPTFGYLAPITVYCLAVQADGKILVGGQFATAGSAPSQYLARLNQDGTWDTTFRPGCDSLVYTLALQADGKILVGGNFRNLGGLGRQYVCRLNADGTVDAGFNIAVDNAVTSLTVQPDGKILLGGNFMKVAGQTHDFLARLVNTDPAVQALRFDGSTITWLRSGACPEVWRTAFEMSTNGSYWAALGAAERTPGGWRLTNVSVPTNATIRARGIVVGGYCNSSSWFVEDTLDLAAHPQATILTSDGDFGFRSNSFGFNLTSAAGSSVVVESSTNLTEWLPLVTNAMPSGSLYFSDPESANLPLRFYRARSQ